jgi:hypothetical protein
MIALVGFKSVEEKIQEVFTVFHKMSQQPLSRAVFSAVPGGYPVVWTQTANRSLFTQLSEKD